MAENKNEACNPAQHNYMPFREPYYAAKFIKGERVKDKSKVIQSFYCTKCGEIIERVIANYADNES